MLTSGKLERGLAMPTKTRARGRRYGRPAVADAGGKGKRPSRAATKKKRSAASRRWTDLLGDVAEKLPADLRRRLGGGQIEQRLAELPKFGLKTGKDGLRWIVERLPLGRIGAALAAANFVWMLVYHLGAPAVLLVQVSSADELHVEVQQAEESHLT